MPKKIHLKLVLISVIATMSLLISLPRIPLYFKSNWFELDSYIGGYVFNFFNGKAYLDLRSVKKGLDLAGGVKIDLRADMKDIAEQDRLSALESAKQVLERRINLLGVSEPSVVTVKSGDEYRILVEIPGIDNIGQAIDLIGQTARLTFKQLDPEIKWSEDQYVAIQSDKEAWLETGITGADLKGAEVIVSSAQDISKQGLPEIKLLFTNEGRRKFAEVAKANVGKPIGLFLDEDAAPLSMPIVSPDLAQGLTDDPVITGNFTFDTAKQLSIQIRAGALPVPVEILQQETIGATLGDESIHKSIYAGIVGLLLVFFFMVFKYGRLGLLAGISLFVYSTIVLTLFKLLGVVLTLPGVAGFVLSIGMATDANILIFERIREEIIWGKPTSLAIKLGFDRAWNSIRDSNVSSLITCLILFRSGDGPVRGFALTLAMGILVSLFSSIFVVKTIIEAWDLVRSQRERLVKVN